MLLNPSELPQGRLLLHLCCAPCSGAIVEALVEAYKAVGRNPAEEMAIFWSNSNIYDKEEYEKRRAEILRYAGLFGIKVIDDDFDHSAWRMEVASGREDAPERGARCLECFRFRLLKAARYAAANGFDALTTSLASSRWKSLEQVEEAGAWACEHASEGLSGPAGKVKWWGRNWRKGGLQPRRSEIIREQNFYNQSFCGCEYSL
ncbi:MAG: epoxyqueuosine reductase QueH [Bacteroidales bacterium]|nr:epoxyqueuosine reductase QueH [Bacteroidales bacterium]